jgi:hypothetical protein
MKMFAFPVCQHDSARSQIEETSVADVLLAGHRFANPYSTIHVYQVPNHSERYHAKKCPKVSPGHKTELLLLSKSSIGRMVRVLYSEYLESGMSYSVRRGDEAGLD